MEFVYLGAVSPVALASAVAEAVVAGEKSPTAAAFELVELERVVADAASTALDDSAVPEVAETALRRIAAARAKVKGAAPDAFAEQTAFHRYERAVARQSNGSPTR